VTTTVTKTIYPTQPGEQTYVTTVTETEYIPEIKTFTYSQQPKECGCDDDTNSSNL